LRLRDVVATFALPFGGPWARAVKRVQTKDLTLL
jgi:hypothetical protein